MMKSLPLYSLFLFGLLAGLSCKKDDGLAPGFDMFYQREFSIPAGIGIFDVHHFQLKNIPSNWDDYLADHGKTAADITGIVNAKAELGGVFGDVDLSVIEKISLRLYDESKPNDYIEIAYRDPTPLDSGNLLPLIPSLADAKRILSLPRFSADVVVWLRYTTQDQSDVRINFTMRAAL